MVCTWPMGIAMEFEELYEKYKKLLVEVKRLKEENSQLKNQLGMTRSKLSQDSASAIKLKNNYRDYKPVKSDFFPDVNKISDSLSKV